MDDKRIKLSIIIVSYKNLDVLSDCLNSIVRFNDIGDALETIIVEQSDDHSMVNAIRSGWPWTKVVVNPNYGFGAGNNRGVCQAAGEYLLFLNPDTVLIEPLFSFALERFNNDLKLGLFGVRLLNATGGHNPSFHFRRPYGLGRAFLWHICDGSELFFPHAMYITGADMFVRKSAFNQIGGFDERMFMYFEETFLCDKLNGLGLKIGYFPQKHIVHLEGKSSGGVNTLARQIDSLKYLCEETGWSYPQALRHMRRDRIIKTLLGSDRSQEVALIDDALNKEQQ